MIRSPGFLIEYLKDQTMKFTVLTVTLLVLSACATSDLEMPYEPEGTDTMRKSPCACLSIEYTPATFEWIDAPTA